MNLKIIILDLMKNFNLILTTLNIIILIDLMIKVSLDHMIVENMAMIQGMTMIENPMMIENIKMIEDAILVENDTEATNVEIYISIHNCKFYIKDFPPQPQLQMNIDDDDDFESTIPKKIRLSAKVYDNRQMNDDLRLACALSASTKTAQQAKPLALSKHNMSTVLPPEEALALLSKRVASMLESFM